MPQSSLDQALSHPTSEYLKNAKNKSEYFESQLEYLIKIEHKHKNREKIELFKEDLSEKEIESILHQYDLYTAIALSPHLLDHLHELGFKDSAYFSGSFHTDLGKLISFQKLFYESSEKSTLFYHFLQGKGPTKTQNTLKEIFKTLGFKNQTFLNPNTSINELKKIFKNFPVLRSYLHEFPGMLNSSIAYEINLINKDEFIAEFLVNLFHAGPPVGYWGLLEKRILPLTLQNEGNTETIQKVFQDSIFWQNDSRRPHYGMPFSFEGFIGSLFDRISQFSERGFLKIDFEIGGPPLSNLKSLLLTDNYNWTIEQIEELIRFVKISKNLNKKQSQFIIQLCEKSLTYLKALHQFLETHIQIDDIPGVKIVTISYPKKYKEQGIIITKMGRKYEFTDHKHKDKKEYIDEREVRKLVHRKLNILFTNAEEQLGNPFNNFEWMR